MSRLVLLIACCLVLVSSVGCSGMRSAGGQFAVHAECFRIVGIPIPEDDQAKAASLVPSGATIVSEDSTPADWTSFIGFFGNLFGFHSTRISGTN